MRIVFVSNWMSPHQQPLCDRLAATTERFCFIETGRVMAENRRQLGWGEKKPDYVISGAQPKLCAEKIVAADVVMVGSAPYDLVRERIRRGGWTVFCSERIYKKPLPLWKLPYHQWMMFKKFIPYKNVYLFANSAYAAADYNKTHAFGKRMLQFGYFPQTMQLSPAVLEARPQRLLWVGRMLDWKHPETAVEIAHRLAADGIDFSMDLVGEGPALVEVVTRMARYGLSERVHLLGALPFETVREKMTEYDIYLATSDRGEGWGAVINEAMNAGLAVVADRAMGAAPCLIRDGVNGYLYADGDLDTLYDRVCRLLTNPQQARAMGKAAYATITDLWNAEVAADRAVEVFRALLEKKPLPQYESGPCSKAKILKDGGHAK